MERDHPEVYASRHVVSAVVQLLVGVVGIGAVVRGVLPRLGVPVPDVNLPDVAVPDWIGTVFGWYDAVTSVPVGWVRSFARWAESSAPVPAWSWTLIHTAKFWGPLLIAVLVAVSEVERRRRRDRTTPPEERMRPPA